MSKIEWSIKLEESIARNILETLERLASFDPKEYGKTEHKDIDALKQSLANLDEFKKDDMKCGLCGRECTNLEDGVCCFERNMHPHLFDLEDKPCDSCEDQGEIIAEQMENLKHEHE